jgi:hypothetical protein
VRDPSTLPLAIGGTVFAAAGVLLIVFRVQAAAFQNEINRWWRALIRSEHRTTVREIAVIGSAWLVIGALLAVLGFVYI